MLTLYAGMTHTYDTTNGLINTSNSEYQGRQFSPSTTS